MTRTLSLLLAASLAWTSTTSGQNPATPPHDRLPGNVDSGDLDNRSPHERVVFAQVVRVPGAAWFQLRFGERTRLDRRSYLRMTASRDGAVQRHDAKTLGQWDSSSALWNGDELLLELVAGPYTAANRVDVVEILRGFPTPAPESICGPTDDRVQSNDPRQGRLWIGCTGWLIGRDVLLTAGHCVTSTPFVLEMNVPNSTSGGSVVRAAPNDQYPYTVFRSLNAGVGSDWAVCRVQPNSNTGQLPTDRNGGQWYSLGAIPGAPGGQTIRITGYGSSSIGTLNLVQKTHTGPLSQVNATSLCYATDTTGGNSGSPILHENTGHAIGIHTHGGCSSTGGCNNGTRSDRSDLQQAIRDLNVVPGRFDAFGSGCPGTGRTPSTCLELNGSGGALTQQTTTNEYAYVAQSGQVLQVAGFRVFTSSATGAAVNATAALYLDAGGTPAGAPSASATMVVGTSPGFYEVAFASPVSVPAGRFYLGLDSTQIHVSQLSSGSAGSAYWRRPPGSGTWNTSSLVSTPAWQVVCTGGGQPNAVPVLGSSGRPELGQAFALELSRAAANAPAVFVIAASNTSWNGIPLPFSLGGLGAPGCSALVGPDIPIPTTADAQGAARVSLPIPNDPALVSLSSHAQVLVLDPPANALGIAVTNGGTITVGG